MAVEGRLERPAVDRPENVLRQDLRLEVDDGTGLGGGDVRGVAEGEDIFMFFERSVRGSVGRKRNSSPIPERSIISAPMFVGTVTRRS